MSDIGDLIVSRYNVILHCFSRNVNTTCLPLWSTPPPIRERVAIAIGLVHGNHFVNLKVEGEYLMPPITPQC